jgi:hypothetical protein
MGPRKQAPNPNGRRSRQTSPISDQHCGKTVTATRIQSLIYGRETQRTPLGYFQVSTHSFRNAVAKTKAAFPQQRPQTVVYCAETECFITV